MDIPLLRSFKGGRAEKLGLGEYLWVSRCVVILSWKGLFSAAKSVQSLTPHWFGHTDRQKQSSSHFSRASVLNVKWTAVGDEAEPLGGDRLAHSDIWWEKMKRKSESNTRLVSNPNNSRNFTNVKTKCKQKEFLASNSFWTKTLTLNPFDPLIIDGVSSTHP